MAHKIYGQNVTIISGGGGSQPQLNAPTISITGNTLTITNPTSNGDFVTAYKVYTEYGYVATVTETTVDLTTIITENGTYNVFVTCVGTNFKDSIASNAVSWSYTRLATPQNVTADGTTVSWDEVENATSYEILADGVSIGTVENVTEDPLAGTWVLNDTIIYTNINPIISFNFTSNNTSFYGFYFDVNSDGDNSLGYRTNQQYSFNQIYNIGGNIISGKEAYKTITITSKLSEVTNGDSLLAWLQANATKQ